MEVFFRNKHDAREQKHTHTHLIELSRIELWPFLKSEVAVELVRLISICFVVFFWSFVCFCFPFFMRLFVLVTHRIKSNRKDLHTHTRF